MSRAQGSACSRLLSPSVSRAQGPACSRLVSPWSAASAALEPQEKPCDSSHDTLVMARISRRSPADLPLGANRHDEVLRATLLSNRAAAHVMLKNWAKAFDDASAALEAEVLPPPQRLKAARRAARAALRLGKLQLAHAACQEASQPRRPSPAHLFPKRQPPRDIHPERLDADAPLNQDASSQRFH